MLEMLAPYLKAALILGALIFCIYGVSWLLKKYSSFSGFALRDTGDIKITSLKQIDPHAKIAVVRWKESSYLIGLTGQNFTLIDTQQEETKHDI